ncbi:MAG: endonuclease, partial [Synergistaceae bacterium]|nr:endonuclease [Synergistaceae bacterium]
MGDFVLAFDPGRDKTGFAFVDFDGGLIASGIFPTQELERFLAVLSPYVIEGTPPENAIPRAKLIITGNGTHSREFTGRAEAIMGRGVMTVDERNTTLEARGLYW